VTTPYVPFPTGGQSPLRAFYSTVAQVLRLAPSLAPGGGMTTAWNPLSAIVDPVLDEPGLLACRIALGFLRPGQDAPAPFVAGRAQDRVGVCYFDLSTDENGNPFVLAGDRLLCVDGPIRGTFEIRAVPDVALGFQHGHHVEVQVIEVAHQFTPPTPFPGGAP
jgi:hypothetical protein